MPESSALSFELTLPEAASPGNYRFLGMRGREALGRLFEYHIRFASDKPAIDALKMLGDKVVLAMETADGTRHFHACVTGFAYRGPIDLPLAAGAKAVTQFQYAVVARPWVWFLTRSADCRVFQKLKVPEIIDQILGKYTGMTKKVLSGDYQPWEYCVQYRETDFNFVSRLMEQEGIFYYFTHEASDHKLVLVDAHGPGTAASHSIAYVPGERAGRMDKECIRDWTMAHEVQPGAYAIKDYDFKKPTAPQLSVVKRPYKHAQGALEIFDYPGEFDTPGEGDGYVRIRLDELHTQYETVRALCNVRALAVGDVFELDNPEQAGAAADAKYLVTEASYDIGAGLEFEAQGPHYGCSFACMRSEEQFRPQRSTPKPTVQGPQTATVVGPSGEEIHTDEYGRIKVRFHWDRHSQDDKESSCWVRVSHPWAGKNFGMIAIPRMGQEVVIDFLEGDPDRPLVTGRVYNQDNMPPYALPANKTQTGIVTRSSLGGSAANANSLRFEDKKGSEQVYLHAEKNQDIEVENDETHWVGHDRSKTIDHDETTHVKHDRTETVDNDETITIHHDRSERVDNNETISIGVDRSEDVGSNETISIGANRSETVGGNESISISKNRTESVGGNESVSVTKNRTMDITQDETLSVGKNQTISVGENLAETVSKNVKVEIGENCETKIGKDDKTQVAKKFYLEAGDEITLKTGDASIVMKKDGTIQIKGKDITITGSGKIGIKASGDMVLKGSKIAEN